MILLLLATLQTAPAQDTIPIVTLDEALRMGTHLDPGYVFAIRQAADAAWQRRAATAVFLLPSISAQMSATRFSTDFFNIGTGELASQIVSGQVTASYDLLRGGAKFFELSQRRREFESAEAGIVEAEFRTALLIESDYYDVLAQQELLRVADERAQRADEQLDVARGRVLSGAAVQTDSLQLRLERTRAQVEVLQQGSRARVARLQLGRRIGLDRAVGAASIPEDPPATLPITDAQAVDEALGNSPALLVTRSEVRAAEAANKAAWGSYLPRVTLTGQVTSFDDRIFPTATTRLAIGFTVSVPIWDSGQRELALSIARSRRAVADATNADAERATRRNVIEAYENYTTARASTDLAYEAVNVARENLRVQEERYRAGATTIIDLLTAQVSLAESEAGLVQARYGARLALAGLEAILGRRLFNGER